MFSCEFRLKFRLYMRISGYNFSDMRKICEIQGPKKGRIQNMRISGYNFQTCEKYAKINIIFRLSREAENNEFRHAKYAKFRVQKKYVFKTCEFQVPKKGRHRGMRLSTIEIQICECQDYSSKHAIFNVISYLTVLT